MINLIVQILNAITRKYTRLQIKIKVSIINKIKQLLIAVDFATLIRLGTETAKRVLALMM